MKNTIGNRIKILRESLDFSSQNKFAKELGTLQATLSNYEADKNKPHQNFYDILLKKYPNLNLNWLQFGEGEIWNDGKAPENYTYEKKDDKEDIIEFFKNQIAEKDRQIEKLMNLLKPTPSSGFPSF